MKIQNNISFLFLASFIFGITGCISVDDHHKIFINNMNHKIGTSFTEFKNRKGHLGEEKLNTGIVEHEFLVINDRCHLFVQVDNEDVIVNWRFEAKNPELDCSISP